jgi:hypothetical protein
MSTNAPNAYAESLEKTLTWIESHQSVDMIANYCDPESMQCYGKSLRGWSSPHLTQDIGVQGWSTAQTITCISRMRRVVTELMHDDVLSEFGGRVCMEPVNTSWERLLDSDIGSSTLNNVRTLKDILQERVIVPFSQIEEPAVGASYSAILFGPPGTAKVCTLKSPSTFPSITVIDKYVDDRRLSVRLYQRKSDGPSLLSILRLFSPMACPMLLQGSDTSLTVFFSCGNVLFCSTKLKSFVLIEKRRG